MTTSQITPPAALAVSLVDAKLQLRIDHDALDTSITLWIQGITSETEHAVARAFITQGWRLTLPSFDAALVLDHPPISSVESVSYYDTEGVLQVLPPAAYQVRTDCAPGRITPTPGASWPATYARDDAVLVDYTCGYGPTDAAVPANAKLYILAKLSVQFDPAPGGAGTVGKPYTVGYLDRLLDRITVYG